MQLRLILSTTCVVAVGCFNPDKSAQSNASDGTTNSGETSSVSLSGTSTSSSPTTSAGSTDPTVSTSDTDPTSASGTTETTGPATTCNDGKIDPGELCYGDPDTYATGDEPSDVAIGDMDNDGALDILTVSYETGALSIIESNGIGGFTAPTNLNAGQQPSRVRIADFDSDGDDDIAIAGGNVVTYWNQSGSQVQQMNPGTLAGGFGIHSMEVMEGNGDTIPDIVYSGAYTYIFATGSIANSRWVLSDPTSIIAAGEGASGIWATEFAWDTDSFGDVIGINQYSSGAVITTGNGDGTFTEVSTHQICPGVAAGARHLVTADLDGESSQDIIATCMDGDFTVSLGNGDGSWADHVVYSLDGAHRPYAYDLDLDGDVDVLVPSATLNRVALYVNDGTGDLTLSTVELSTDGPPYGIEVADLNDDGSPDVVTAVHDGAGLAVVWLSRP